jgi:outer membrane murein-binding lipoprotein Lpp
LPCASVSKLTKVIGPALRATNHTWNTIVDDLNEIVSELKEKLEDLIIAGAAAAEGAKAKAELETKVSRLEEEVLRLREEVKTEMGRAEYVQ